MAAKVVYALHIYMWYSKGTQHCACRMHPGIYTGGRITGLGQDIKDAAANLSAALGKGESCAVHTCLYALVSHISWQEHSGQDDTQHTDAYA